MSEKDNQIIPVEEQEYSVEPSRITDFAVKASKELKEIVSQSKGTVKLSGNEYLKFEAWQTVAKFFGSTVSIEWTKPVLMKDKDGAEQIFGYEAKASVIDSKGRVISSAENGCFKDEPNWYNKPSFQLRSMAQTRASAKALRQVYAWVVVLSGYQATPAEEVDNKPSNTFSSNSPIAKRVEKEIKSAPTDAEQLCQKCKDSVTDKVADYSKEKFAGKVFCFNCQRIIKAELEKAGPEGVKFTKPVKRTDASETGDNI
jgi:hypothetical protein